MIGYRAFGRNEGGLNHAGDFVLLFAPLLGQLADLAMYGLEVCGGLTFPFYWKAENLDDADRQVEAICATLDRLDMCPHEHRETGIQWPRYLRPGFFPDLAGYIEDDWNDFVCFGPPFPEYGKLVAAEFGSASLDWTLKERTPEEQRQAWLDTGFAFYFRNIDACWWEVFSPDTEAMARLAGYLKAEGIAFQELAFERDFPLSSTPVEREFRDVHPIWSPDDPATAE